MSNLKKCCDLKQCSKKSLWPCVSVASRWPGCHKFNYGNDNKNLSFRRVPLQTAASPSLCLSPSAMAKKITRQSLWFPFGRTFRFFLSLFRGVFKLIQFMNEPESLVNINRRELLFKLDFYDKSLVGLTAVV